MIKNPPPTPAQHARFLQSLDASQQAKFLVGSLLNERYPVTFSAIARAPTAAEAKFYSDDGDLYIGQRIEVKHLSAMFTGRHDWPFKDFIVCGRYQFDRANPKPHRHIIVNRDMTHVGVALTEDRAHWTVQERSNSKFEGRRAEFYVSPVELVRFFPIEALAGR